MTVNHHDAVVAAAHAAASASKATYVSSAGLFGFGALTLSELGIIAGILLGLATFLVNSYFQWRAHQMKQERHDALRQRQFESTAAEGDTE